MMGDILNNCLTIYPMVDNLAVLSPHVKVGITTPRKGEKSPLPLVVFFRPQFSINAGLIRVKFIMVDCFRETLCLARSFAGCSNLIQSATRYLLPNGGGTYTLIQRSHRNVTK